jgi:hypothetical protein
VVLREPAWTIVNGVGGAVLTGALMVGLRDRKAWAWTLNWVVIGLFCVVFAARIPWHALSVESIFWTIAGVLWVVPNAVYFARRRALFR